MPTDAWREHMEEWRRDTEGEFYEGEDGEMHPIDEEEDDTFLELR